MLVVSDTGPINYLILIDLIELVPKLFDRVAIPQAVFEELNREGSPEIVRRWARHPPPWLEVHPPTAVRDLQLNHLDEGERSAILLARHLSANALLADDYAAYAQARREGMKVIRTLALLRIAANRGWIDLAAAIALLRKTNFRVRQDTLDLFLK